MPKVLLVFPVSDVGGGENVLLNLARFRERRDLEYRALVIADEDGPLMDALSSLGVSALRVRRGRMANPFALFGALRGARAALRDVSPDVFLANSSQGYLYARWAAGARIPGMLYFMSVPIDGKISALDTLTWRVPPVRVFAASRTIALALERQGVRHVSTVYHGTPEPVATPAERALVASRLEEFGVRPTSPLVLMPGRLQRWKGQLAFVKAFSRVAASGPDAHAVLIGAALFGREEAFRLELASEIRTLGLDRRVHLAGHMPVAAWLERAACVVHASLAPDAFPNVCLEALAARKPLVTNAECGVAEILQHGRDAWIVPPRNIEALSEAIQDALADAARSARIGAAGYDRYLEHCTPQHMVRPIERELCEAAGVRVGAMI